MNNKFINAIVYSISLLLFLFSLKHFAAAQICSGVGSGDTVFYTCDTYGNPQCVPSNQSLNYACSEVGGIKSCGRCGFCQVYNQSCYWDGSNCQINYAPYGGGGCPNGSFYNNSGCSCTIPNCNTGAQQGSGCYNYPYNTCYNGNGIDDWYYHSYSGGGSCNVVFAYHGSCTVNNCDGGQGYFCSGANCVRDCNTGTVNCQACHGGSLPTNTCGTANNGTQTCQHDTWNGQNGCIYQDFAHTCSLFVDNCSNTFTCTNGNTCETSMTVHVFWDYDHNDKQDNNNPDYSGAIIDDGQGDTGTTNSNGDVTFNHLTQGNYTITLTNLPAGATYTSASSFNVTLDSTHPGNRTVATFGITPLYSMSGTIFNDINKDQNYEPASPDSETPYTKGSTITVTGPSHPTGKNFSVDASGNYNTGQNLLSGNYTVQYNTSITPLPGGYTFTTQSTWNVVLGEKGTSTSPVCSIGTSPDAVCGNPWNGSISGLNFGVTNENAWHQSICSDSRFDGGYSQEIPATADCNGTSGPYAIVQNAALCPANPGTLYSGNTNPTYGGGLGASTSNQVVGDSLFPENFTSRLQNVFDTSYNFVTTSITQLAIPTTPLTSLCPDLSNCVLSEITPGGIYTTTPADGPVSLSISNIDGTFQLGNANYTFVIGGDLTFTSKVIAQTGTGLTFISGGNIHVKGNVGESDWTSLNPDLEGFYSADSNFYADALYPLYQQCQANGQPKELKLNTKGSIITNAGGNGGTVINNRDGCLQDLSCPTVTFNPDPNEILSVMGNISGGGGGGGGGGSNYASGALKTPYTFWQELNP